MPRHCFSSRGARACLGSEPEWVPRAPWKCARTKGHLRHPRVRFGDCRYRVVRCTTSQPRLIRVPELGSEKAPPRFPSWYTMTSPTLDLISLCFSASRPRGDSGTWQRLRRAAADLRRMQAEFVVLQRQMCVETGRAGSGDGYTEETLLGGRDGRGTGAHHRASDNPGAGAFYTGRGTPQRYVADRCKQFPLKNQGEHGRKTAIGECRRARQGAAADCTLQSLQLRGREKTETLSTGTKQEASIAPASIPLQDPSRCSILRCICFSANRCLQ